MKNNYFKNKVKNISNTELSKSLKQSLEYNSEAIDYIENLLNQKKDFAKYKYNNELDSEINILRYIHFTLKFIDGQYKDSLKKVGG